MSVKVETPATRGELSGSQRALLDERLKRAKHAASKPGETRSAIPTRPPNEDVPLSFAQQRLWFIDQLEPGSAVYNVCQAVRMRGALDVSLLQRALNEIVRRHEVLRTNFVAVDGRPVQVIVPERPLLVEVVELTGSEQARRREAEHWLHEETRRPFDLARDALIRAVLIQHSETEHILLLTLHHIISDGWSVGVLFHEMSTLYQAFRDGMAPSTALPDLPIQYADYVFWERDTLQGPALERLLSFWTRQLQPPLPTLDLPTDHPHRAGSNSRGAAHMVQLPRPLSQALKSLGQQEGATPFMTLLAAFQVLLSRWTGQTDIVVGSVVAGRRRVELERLVGFFVNTLVFRGDLSLAPSFRQFLAQTRDTAMAVLAHQDLPFERLVNELRPDRTASRNPLFQVMFVLQNAPMSPTDLPGLHFEPIDVENGTSKFDLTLSMMEGPDGLRAGMEYNADLFSAETIARLMRAFETLLESIVLRPDEPVTRLPLLSGPEREQILAGWNATTTEYARDLTIAEVFARQVKDTPEALALVFGDARLTYRELDSRSNRLARWLQRHGVGPETLVAISMERCDELVVALLAIVKAGGTYVSLDPSYPAERLAFMLRDTAAPVLITHRKLRPMVDGVVRTAGTTAEARADFAGIGNSGSRNSAAPAAVPPVILNVDSDWAEVGAESDEPVAAEVGPEHLAYVSYTSGSTGQPKGVCVPHRGVVRLVKNTNYAQFSAQDVFLQFAPVAFDASTLEIWGALLNGAQLVVFPPGPSSLAELGEFVERRGVTTLWLTAGLFHQMVEEQVDRLKGVRQLLAGGDVLSPAHVARALERLPQTRLINGYGPTENTTFTCCHTITTPPVPGQSIPIGRPIANTRVYILDPHLQPVPVGVPGELYTGGDGLARGYLNRPELTADKFIVDPFSPPPVPGAAGSPASRPDGVPTAPKPRLYRTGDRARWLPDGTVEFLGRMDRQVKIRGFRVEPGEIESVLATHPAVRECAVVVRDGPGGDKRLVAYIVPAEAPIPSPEVWRVHLMDRLPDYLVPSAFVALDALPLNANGKVDLAALPSDDGIRPDLQGEYVAPRDDLERQLVGIWEDVLNVRPVGVHDQFFALGGHSLLAVRMVAQLEKKLGRKLPVATIFQHRTVDRLARLLRGSDRVYSNSSSIVEIKGRGSKPPLYLVHGVGGGMFWGYGNLARLLGDDQPLFAFKSRGLDGLPEWPTIEELASSYVKDLRAHQPHGPYLLGGYCFGGIVAYEMARQLHEVGEKVSLLALINGSPPNTSYQNATNRASIGWALRFIANFSYWLGCFTFRWTWRERQEFVRWKLRVVWKRRPESTTQNHAQVALGDIDQLVDLAAYSDEQRGLWRSHVKALIAYRPRPYDGRVTLIRTRGHPLMCSFDYQYGWGELARGGVEVKVVRGGHGNVLADPYVQSVAQALRPCLDAAALDVKQEAKP